MRTFASATLIVFAALLAGCGDSHEDALEDMIDVMEDFADVLEDVKDPASALAAKGEIEALAARMEEIQKRADAMEEPDEARQKELQEKYEAKLMGAMRTLQQHTQRIMSNPEIAAALGEALEKLGDF